MRSAMAQDVTATEKTLLEVRELRKSYRQGGSVSLSWAERPRSTAVDGVSLRVAEGETFAVVGESGCGKTTRARLLLQLIRPDSGQLKFAGQDLLALSGAVGDAHRGNARREVCGGGHCGAGPSRACTPLHPRAAGCGSGIAPGIRVRAVQPHSSFIQGLPGPFPLS
jgi:energy-coupling factor transporter ATP-binding protein EcfA2